jgi:hypothetical protein
VISDKHGLLAPPMNMTMAAPPSTLMKLLRLCAKEIQVGRPLPWGVRNEPGQLLLNKGAVLHDADQLAALLERGMFVDADEYEDEQRRQAAAKASVFDPFSVWAAIQRQVGHLLRTCHARAEGGDRPTRPSQPLHSNCFSAGAAPPTCSSARSSRRWASTRLAPL